MLVTIESPLNTAAILSVILLVSSFCTYSQENSLTYQVSYKGEVVGNMQFYQKKSQNDVYMKMTSHVHMRLIMPFKVQTEEEAQLHKGKLVYSRVYRSVNGKEKINRVTKAPAAIRQVAAEDNTSPSFDELTTCNLLLIFMHEPKNVRKIYSNHFQQLLPLKKVEQHKYKLELPDGNYNYYSYLNGVCNRIEVHQSFYTILITLKGAG